MNSFLEPVTLLKMNFFLDIFVGFCLQVSEVFFQRTPPPCIFLVIVNGLCMVVLRIMLTIRSIITKLLIS